MKQIKRTNLTFLCSVILGVVEMCLVALLSLNNVRLGIITSLILSQATIVIPGLVFLLVGKESIGSQISFKKLKITSVLMLIVFVQLCMPLVSAVNIFTQLFEKNAAAELSSEIIDISMLLSIFVIGFLGPFCEELFFRGVIFGSLKRSSGRIFASVAVSAAFFGIMHMNVNQCAYAFLLGSIFAFINASLDSIWPSVICHVTINTQNVILSYILENATNAFTEDNASVTSSLTSGTMLIIMAGIMLAISLFTTILAALLFVGICNNEGKYENMMSLFRKPEGMVATKKPVLTVSGYIAISICIYIMFLIKPTIMIIKMFVK